MSKKSLSSTIIWLHTRLNNGLVKLVRGTQGTKKISALLDLLPERHTELFLSFSQNLISFSVLYCLPFILVRSLLVIKQKSLINLNIPRDARQTKKYKIFSRDTSLIWNEGSLWYILYFCPLCTCLLWWRERWPQKQSCWFRCWSMPIPSPMAMSFGQ